MKKHFNKEDFIFTIVFVLVSFVLFGFIIARVIAKKDFNDLSNILFFWCLIYAFYKIIMDKNYTKLFVNEKDLKIPLKKRKNKYLFESLLFAILITLITIIGIIFFDLDDTFITIKNVSNIINIIINSLITFIISFGISYLLTYLLNEKLIKRRDK